MFLKPTVVAMLCLAKGIILYAQQNSDVSIAENYNLTPQDHPVEYSADATSISVDLNTLKSKVELISFELIRDNDQVLIQWITQEEINTNKFFIERSADGVKYQVIAQANAAGYSNKQMIYEVADVSPVFGNSYYRLVQVNADNSEDFLEENNIYISGISKVIIYPNPAVRGDEIRVYTNASFDEKVNLFLINESGMVVQEQLLRPGNNKVILDKTMESGPYLFKIEAGTRTFQERMVIY